MKEIIESSQAPLPIGPYSQATRTDGYVFVSGQLPVDPAHGSIPESIADQTRQSVKNLQAILNQAGSSLGSVVKTTVFITDMTKFDEMNKVYSTFFGQNPPARTCIEVSKLPKNAAVEIEAIATIDEA